MKMKRVWDKFRKGQKRALRKAQFKSIKVPAGDYTDALHRIGAEFRGIIKVNAMKGKGFVEGKEKSFEAYSKGYTAKKKAEGKRTKPPNLKLSGAMHDAMTYIVDEKNNGLEVGIVNPTLATRHDKNYHPEKYKGLNKSRGFFGDSPDEYPKEVLDEWDNNFHKYMKKQAKRIRIKSVRLIKDQK